MSDLTIGIVFALIFLALGSLVFGILVSLNKSEKSQREKLGEQSTGLPPL